MDRSIVVRVAADVSNYTRGMVSARRATDEFASSTAGAIDQVNRGGRGMGRELIQSARDNSQAWRTVGTTLTAVGAATTAASVATLKTGISYNSLRQTATQALVSVTGSIEGANAQMARLDNYGRTSWLMRDVLVRSQQQMTGFGISTQKVVPYMSALADAVAGTTGNSQAFEELAQVMGKVQSQGRITARELEQFGIRGIDAAQLIGDAMGKTADQIRSEISEGTFDANTALDALAEGMVMKYEGASDLIRDTFSGAVDNMKAAWRDLAAELSTPLVDPEGGGILVDATNGVADFLNTIRELPGPLSDVVFWGGSALGAIGLLGGGALLAAPKILEVQAAVRTLKTSSGLLGGAIRGATRVMGPLGIALGAGMVATGLFMESQRRAEAAAEELRSTLDAQTGAVTENTRELVASRLEQDGWLDLGRQLGLEAGVMTDAFLGNADAAQKISDAFHELEMDTTLLGQSYRIAEDGTRIYTNRMSMLQKEIRETGEEIEEQGRKLLEHKGEVESSTDATDSLREAQERNAAATEEANRQLQEQIDALSGLRSGAMDADRAHVNFENSIATLTSSLAENGATLDVNTQKGRDNRDELRNRVDALNTHIAAMIEDEASIEDASDALSVNRERIIAAGVAAGFSEQEMRDYIDTMLMTPEEVKTRIEANTAPARTVLDQFLDIANRSTGTVTVRAATDNAIAAVNRVVSHASNQTAYVRIRTYGQGEVATGGPITPIARGLVHARAGGGPVRGPGGPTDDMVPASGPWGTRFALSNGEWVIKAAAVSKYGEAFMSRLNAGIIEPAALGIGRAGGGPTDFRHYTPAPQRYMSAPPAPAPQQLSGVVELGPRTIRELIDGGVAVSIESARGVVAARDRAESGRRSTVGVTR